MDKFNEKKLLRLVEKWTDHFKCRKDFDGWKKKRIWQEDYQQARIESIKEVVPGLAEEKILDLGCGMGGLLVALKKEGLDAVGLDLNPDYCEITRLRGRRYNLNIEVINSKAEDMPLQNDSFDLIICNDMIEHVQSPEKVLNGCRRILKKNGKVLIDVTNRFGFIDHHYHLRFLNWFPRMIGNSITEAISKKDIRSFKDCQRLRDMHYFTMRSFEAIVKKIGFSGYLNLTKKELVKPGVFLAKIPGFEAFVLNLYLSSWRYLLIK